MTGIGSTKQQCICKNIFKELTFNFKDRCKETNQLNPQDNKCLSYY